MAWRNPAVYTPAVEWGHFIMIAIMVPAWKESDVIASMVENLVQVMDYQQYVVFIGTYCNDRETIDEVERMARRYPQLQRVEVPHAGPTCKADCLNWVIQAIFLYEQTHSQSFAGVVLHDSEDVLHPLELKFFNYLLPRKDMIQLPVASLEREWYEYPGSIGVDSEALAPLTNGAAIEFAAGEREPFATLLQSNALPIWSRNSAASGNATFHQAGRGSRAGCSSSTSTRGPSRAARARSTSWATSTARASPRRAS